MLLLALVLAAIGWAAYRVWTLSRSEAELRAAYVHRISAAKVEQRDEERILTYPLV